MNLNISSASFSSIPLSITEFFSVFPLKRVVTLIQSDILVCLISNLDMYLFVLKLAIDVNRVVLDDITIPRLGLTIDRVQLVIVEAYPNNVSEIFKNIFSYFLILYKFFYKNHS